MSINIALLLIDVQEDFLRHPALLAEKAALIKNISHLLENARNLKWSIIHVRTLLDPYANNAMPHWKKNGMKCIKGTSGSLPPVELQAKDNEEIIPKQFFSGFSNGYLENILNARGIDTVVLCGIHTHACVRATAMDAYTHGFKVYIAKDAVGSYDKQHGKLSLDWLKNKAAECIHTEELFIELSSSKTTNVWLHRNPVNWHEVFQEVHNSGVNEVSISINKVESSLKQLQTLGFVQRRDKLSQWHSHLMSERNNWVDLLVKEIAKPIRDAEAEVMYGLNLIKFLCQDCSDEEQISNGIVKYKSHGIVAVITPWNNPFAIAVSKLAPALLYANGVIWKPASSAYSISKMIYKSLIESDLGDFVGLVFGNATSGKIVVNHKSVKAVTFTGSVEVGRKISRMCAKLSKPLQAEMGGNNAAIILKDMANQSVAQELASAMFSFSGQRCTAIRRIIVENSAYETFTKLLTAEVQKLKVGFPSDYQTQIGPLNSKEHKDYLISLLREAKNNGATIVTGGKEPDNEKFDNGNWLEPTIVTNISENSPLFKEETFAPIAVIIKAIDLNQAINYVNNVEHGLLATIFTKSKEAQTIFSSYAQAGILSINWARPDFSTSGPFNGWKSSGFGIPEHGRWNRDFYTKVQTIYEKNSIEP